MELRPFQDGSFPGDDLEKIIGAAKEGKGKNRISARELDGALRRLGYSAAKIGSVYTLLEGVSAEIVDDCPVPAGEPKIPEDVPETVRDYVRGVCAASPVNPEREKALVRRIASGDAFARKELAEAYLGIAARAAEDYLGKGLSYTDLILAGNLGLMKAMDRFEARKGIRFATYATWWVRQSMIRAVSTDETTVRLPLHMIETIDAVTKVRDDLQEQEGEAPTAGKIAETLGIDRFQVEEALRTAQDFIQDEPEELPEPAPSVPEETQIEADDQAALMLLNEDLQEILPTLTAREERILRYRFGFGDGSVHLLEDTASQFRTSPEKIRQIETKVLKRIRKTSKGKNIRDFLDG